MLLGCYSSFLFCSERADYPGVEALSSAWSGAGEGASKGGDISGDYKGPLDIFLLAFTQVVRLSSGPTAVLDLEVQDWVPGASCCSRSALAQG